MANVLVIGGAGYIGSATCAWLTGEGHRTWILDDLSTGHAELIIGQGFTRSQAGDRVRVSALLKQERFDCAIHFAAKASVSESVRMPKEYFENNVLQTEALIDELLKAGVKRFIFSSTCAIFGDVGDQTISEDLPKKPINPYGETKLQAEQCLERLARERGLQAIALRYFNAAGAEPGLRVGEWHAGESHLIPLVLKSVCEKKTTRIFGTDYPTPDGTAVRDYIHVSDLAFAHEAAMKRLLALPAGAPGVFEQYNLGSEKGYSVREVVDACRSVAGELEVVEEARRAGDPPRLVADSTKARKILGFRIKYGLKEIIESAWAWEKKHQSRARAVFLDRDGTLNDDPGYLSDPSQMKLLPGVGDALARLKGAGYKLVVISNQSGVGRGLIAPNALPKIHDRLEELLAPFSVHIDEYQLCLHRPEESCDCRKPKAKLLLNAVQSIAIDLSRSFMVGDKQSDVEAGRNAGCRASVLVRTGLGKSEEAAATADFTADSIGPAVDWILAQGT